MRGLFGAIAAKSDTTSANPAQWFRDWLAGGSQSASGIVVSQMEALHDVVTMACVQIRSADLAKLPVHVKRRMKNGGSEIIKNHAVERLLRRPNSWQTKFEFFEMMQACYLLKSNAYAPIKRNGRGEPVEMIPVNPDRACLYEAPGGDLFYQITRGSQHEIADLAGFPMLISADDVVHLKGLSLNGLVGLSRIGLARDAIGLSLALERYSSALFARGARPSGVLETEKTISPATFDRIKAQLADRHEGLGNQARTMILEEGLKWSKQQMTSVEADTVNARRLQIEQIATAFDVPLHRLGIIPDGGGTAILQAHQMYLNNTLSSDAERWENKLNDMFGLEGLENGEIGVEFDLDYFNRADIQTRFTAIRTGIIGGFIKINEARRWEGLPDVDGGDVLLQPTNVAPFPFDPSANTAGPGSDTTGAPAPGGDGDPAAVPDETKRWWSERFETALHDSIQKIDARIAGWEAVSKLNGNDMSKAFEAFAEAAKVQADSSKLQAEAALANAQKPPAVINLPEVKVNVPEIHIPDVVAKVQVDLSGVVVPAPVVNVEPPSVEVFNQLPAKAREITRVTERDKQGRVLVFEKVEIPAEDGE
jgi:HK97 family phage portal protein